MKFWKKSLMARLVIYFLLLSLVTVSLVGYIAFLRAREALTQAVFDQLETATTLKEDELNRWVADQRQDVLLIAALPEVRTQAEVLLSHAESEPEYQSAYALLSDYMAAVAARKLDLQEIFILTDVGGKVILSTDKTHEGEYHTDASYFTQGRLGVFVQNVYPSPITGKPTMTIATPLLNEVGRQLGGVLAVHLDLDRMDKIILKRIGLGASGETYLVDRFNVFVSAEHFGRQEFLRGVHTEGIDAALQGEDGSGLYLNYEGVPVIGVYHWLDMWELALLAEMHQQEAFASARQLALTIFLVGLISAGVLAVGVSLLARQIARPILAITDTAIQVAAGDLTPTAPVLTEDEIGVLARAFNLMTGQLRELYEALRHSEEHFRSLIENASDVITTLDGDGTIRYVSPSVERVLGYRPDDLSGKSTFDFVHPDDRPSVVNAFTNTIQNPGVARPLQFRFRHQDGSWRILEAIANNLLDDPVVAGVVVNSRDVTERVRAETRYRSLFEGVPVGLYRTMPAGHILDANPALVQMLGHPDRESLLAASATDLYVSPEARKQWQALMEREGVVPDFEAQIRRRDGTIIWVRDSSRASQDDEGRVLYYEGSLEDITERKQAEEELREYREHLEELVTVRTRELGQKATELEEANLRLQEADRLKSVFLASMSHELRTPLNSIIGFTGIILLGMVGEINEEQRKQLTMVRDSANHLLSLINDVLDIAKIEAGRVEPSPEEFELAEVVREVVESFSPAVSEKGLELTKEMPAGITLFSDRRRVKQVLMNFVSNAVKFTDQGSVRVAVRIVEGKKVEMSVTDTGIGIKEEDMNMLFEPFQQVDISLTKSREGTGLGLYLTKKLAVLLGGDVWAKSEFGKGSEFTFAIPLKHEEEQK